MFALCVMVWAESPTLFSTPQSSSSEAGERAGCRHRQQETEGSASPPLHLHQPMDLQPECLSTAATGESTEETDREAVRCVCVSDRGKDKGSVAAIDQSGSGSNTSEEKTRLFLTPGNPLSFYVALSVAEKKSGWRWFGE